MSIIINVAGPTILSQYNHNSSNSNDIIALPILEALGLVNSVFANQALRL